MLEEAQKHLREIQPLYPDLGLKLCDNGYALYSGKIAFSANFQDLGLIEDEFEVEIMFPVDGMDKVPSAKEIGGRIPRDIDYHVARDGIMCLGAPLDIRRKFKEQPSLQSFIDKVLIPFLYSFRFKQEHGYMPYGELSHGGKGIIEYYRELFDTDSELKALELLKILVEDNYRGHIPCPCSRGERLRNCHGPQIREIQQFQTKEQFESDYFLCLQSHIKSGKTIPNTLITKRLRKYFEKKKSAK